ncbi:MAG: hypothetical protein ACE361_03800 [Aureliella sp.]
MGEINLSNPKGRDAVVATNSLTQEKRIRWLDDDGRQASSIRIVKSTLSHDIEQLKSEHGTLSKLSELLTEGDPEIDVENTGRFLKETSRVYVDKQRGIVRNVRFCEVVKNPDGSERERRPRQLADTNISSDTPLKWTGVFIRKLDAIRKFVFSGKVQLQHVNGLTYDFLYSMAEDLHQRDSLMLLGAGPNSNQPLILRRGGTPYRGFLEGRVDGDRYALLLHFSNQELKVPAEKPPASDEDSTAGAASESDPSAEVKKTVTTKSKQQVTRPAAANAMEVEASTVTTAKAAVIKAAVKKAAVKKAAVKKAAVKKAVTEKAPKKVSKKQTASTKSTVKAKSPSATTASNPASKKKVKATTKKKTPKKSSSTKAAAKSPKKSSTRKKKGDS